MATLAKSSERATYRTVVLLRRSDKVKLQRLAAKEKVSSEEVIRRFIRSGEEILNRQKEEEIVEATLKIISAAVADANASMCRSIDRIDQLHSELSKREIA